MTKIQMIEKLTQKVAHAKAVVELDKKFNAEFVKQDQKKVAKYEAQLAEAKANLTTDDYEEMNKNEQIQKVFGSYIEDLVKCWTEFDLNRQKFIWKRMDEIRAEGKPFYNIYEECANVDYYKYNNEKKFHEDNVKHATDIVVKLVHTCEEKVGKVTSYADLHFHQYTLNGIIIGENGRCSVNTILAGGYNIQRLHVRHLVNKIK